MTSGPFASATVRPTPTRSPTNPVSAANLGHTKFCPTTAIEAEDATFDAVFDFGAIHLELDWRKGISELRRVLKPGGKFYFEWVTGRFLRLPYRFVTEGFGRMEVPDSRELLKELEGQGIVDLPPNLCLSVAFDA